MHNCELVCFSLENADVITKHFDVSHTNVISNRIDIRKRFEDVEKHYAVSNREVNVLIVSRIDKGKVESIYSVLNTLSKCATTEFPINVRIAGEGRCQKDMSVFCDTLQTSCLRIQMLGHVHDLTEQFRWAHIVAGKGRSVIEPIMMNRIGCIIGEDGKIEFCKKENYKNLYHYNFSGRKLRNEDSYTEMHEMLEKIIDGQLSNNFVMENADMTIQNYAVEFLPDKLQYVLDKLPASIRPNHWVSLIYSYIRLVVRLTANSIIYKKESENNGESLCDNQ